MQKFKARHTGNRGRRHKPGEMNKTEERYADVLQDLKKKGEIIEWWFERQTVVLSKDRCRYTADFMVLHTDGSLEMIDVKGGAPVADDSLVKIKMAAEEFWMFQWTMMTELPKKAGGGWERRVF